MKGWRAHGLASCSQGMASQKEDSRMPGDSNEELQARVAQLEAELGRERETGAAVALCAGTGSCA